jgi:hypothetical protein
MLMMICAILPACQKHRTPNPGAIADTPEALAQKWIDSLAVADYGAGSDCRPHLDEIPEIEELLLARGISEARVASRMRHDRESIEEFQLSFMSFLMVTELNKELFGEDLRKATLESTKVTPISTPEGMPPMAKISCQYRIKKKTRGFRFGDCVKLERGWVAISEPEFTN